MSNYRSSVTGHLRSSVVPLGYPWIRLDDDSVPEVESRTADAILADVGTDPTLAKAALDTELLRETPRKVLTARLRAIIASAS